jgi:hypothetical protein
MRVPFFLDLKTRKIHGKLIKEQIQRYEQHAFSRQLRTDRPWAPGEEQK